MITAFDDFCPWMYVLVSDRYQLMAPYFRRPGPEAAGSDAERLTIAVVSECCGWDRATDLIAWWQQHRKLFPLLPSRTRFNRRRRQLEDALALLRRAILGGTGLGRGCSGRYCWSAHARRAVLHTERSIRLLTLPRENHHPQATTAERQRHNRIRQLIETVNSQLAQPFHIEVNHAHSFWGFTARTLTRLNAHTLCIWRNRLLGYPDWLQNLALPI